MGLSLPSPIGRDAEDAAAATLRELITFVSVALITTVDDTGIMHTRQLPNTNAEYDGELWFLSSRGSPLVQEMRANPDVLVTYADRRSSRFVVVNGSAAVRHDPARLRELWHPVLASWLPGGPDDPALALIQVTVKGIDLWD